MNHANNIILFSSNSSRLDSDESKESLALHESSFQMQMLQNIQTALESEDIMNTGIVVFVVNAITTNALVTNRKFSVLVESGDDTIILTAFDILNQEFSHSLELLDDGNELQIDPIISFFGCLENILLEIAQSHNAPVTTLNISKQKES